MCAKSLSSNSDGEMFGFSSGMSYNASWAAHWVETLTVDVPYISQPLESGGTCSLNGKDAKKCQCYYNYCSLNFSREKVLIFIIFLRSQIMVGVLQCVK